MPCIEGGGIIVVIRVGSQYTLNLVGTAVAVAAAVVDTGAEMEAELVMKLLLLLLLLKGSMCIGCDGII